MALLASEITRIRFELGYNTLTVGAEPYISIAPVFDAVIAKFLQAGATTTSATIVAAAASPTPATLTLTSPTGFAAGARVIVDVDTRQEIATIQNLAGSAATMLLAKTHTGTYPVTVEGGETIVREILGILKAVQDKHAGSTIAVAGIKRVEEIEFETGSSSHSRSPHDDLSRQRDYWRDQLAGALGVPNAWKLRNTASSSMSLY